MGNGSLLARKSAPDRSVEALPPTFPDNPVGDFAALHASKSKLGGVVWIDQIHTIKSAPLADLPQGSFVVLTGRVDFVRIFGDEEAFFPVRAVAVLDSGTGAEIFLDIDKRRYQEMWGHLVVGKTIRVSGFTRHKEDDSFSDILDVRNAWPVIQW